MIETNILQTKKTHRNGEPVTVYLPTELSARLKHECDRRHVTKSEVLRVALDRLFTELDRGQLNLPLGLS